MGAHIATRDGKTLAHKVLFYLQDNMNPGAGMTAEELFTLAEEARDSMQPLPGTVISASFGGLVVALDNGVRGAFVFKCDRLLQAPPKPPNLAASPAHTLHVYTQTQIPHKVFQALDSMHRTEIRRKQGAILASSQARIV